MSAPRVVIIGCGFGGLSAAQALRKAPVALTVIDRTNHHLFAPLLYQVATAGLSAPDISAPIRHIFGRQKNATILMAEVARIDVAKRTVVLQDGSQVPYDYLIVAAGAVNHYFGRDEWAPHAPGLKTLAEAVEIRTRILNAYEQAERATDPSQRAAWLTFMVIGAGATGVELAGTLAEIARHTLRGEFRRIDPAKARIVLVEASDRVLPPYTADLSEKALRQLERLGVTVWLGRRVTAIDADGVTMGAERLQAKTVLWAAGVTGAPLGHTLGAPLDRGGRILVEPDLSLPGHPEVFVVGDLAALNDVPAIAPAAKQMGRHASHNILRSVEKKTRLPFRYRDFGQLATIGRNAAVAMMGKLHFSGYPAWLLWLLAHIYFLISFRNRLVVMSEWGWSYWTYQRYARIIISPPK